jgi:5,10-methylenetetrahydromethanopterin reductase
MKPDLPRLGIRLSGAIEPRRCIELAQIAETNGLASVWFAENPFQRGVFTIAGACAAATARVRIGIGVVNPYTRHPAQIAMEFAAIEDTASVRPILGIGSGLAGRIRSLGIANDRPVSAVREAIAIIRAMLRGDPANCEGAVFNVRNVSIVDRSFRLPHQDRTPIYMAGAGVAMLRACGEIADGLIVSNLTPLRSTTRMVAIVMDVAAKAGRPDPTVVQYVPCVVRAHGEEARRAVKSVIGDMLMGFWPVGDDWPAVRETIVLESGIPRGDFVIALDRLRRGEPAASALDDRFVAAFAIAGTAEECLDQATRYRAAGVDELALTFAGTEPGADIAYLARVLAAC